MHQKTNFDSELRFYVSFDTLDLQVASGMASQQESNVSLQTWFQRIKMINGMPHTKSGSQKWAMDSDS